MAAYNNGRSMIKKALAAALLVVTPHASYAQTYPSRPITLIVPFAAGGPADVVARILANVLNKTTRVVVENVGGAGGNLGSLRVARAAPDGYTILFQNISMAISPALYPKLDYSPLKDFETIGLVAQQPNVLLSRPSAPSDFPTFLNYLKTNQSKLSFANTGPGGASHLCAILVMNALNLNITSVPYRGTSVAMNDLIGGQVDLLCDSVATAPPYIQSGVVKAYAVTSKQRSVALPDTPSLHELGLTDFDMVNWTALYAPKNTPQSIIQTLTLKLQEAVQDPDLQAALKRIGSEPMPKERATPEAGRAYLESELKRWDDVIKKAGITLN